MHAPKSQMKDPPRRGSAPRRLRTLLQSGAVRTVFQPIVDLTRGRVMAFEALTRPDPASGYEVPAELFAEAAGAGMLWELEEVTRRVCLQSAADWPADVKLFLNCTPEVFGDPRFVDAIEEGLRSGAGDSGVPIPAERVVLEITEQSDERHIQELHSHLGRLRAAGVEIAIDDVGVGASGLSRIMALRPRWLKLDRQFIEGIHRDSFKQNLVRFFVHFAGLSGVSVIAEGVEHRDELAELIGLGVRYAQGFYLGRPAERVQSLDPGVGAWARERWAEAVGRTSSSVQGMPLASLCRPALQVQATATLSQVLEQLRLAPAAQGVAVFDGRRLIGACARPVLDAAAREHGRGAPVGRIVSRDASALSVGVPVVEALAVAASRPEHQIGAPLVVMDGAEMAGIVPVSALLAAAAGMREAPTRTTAPSILPGRSDAERFVEEAVGVPGSAIRAARGTGSDAAFIDLRRWRDIRGAFGDEASHRLLGELSNMVKAIVGQGAPAVRAWHLGDDRFLAIGPRGSLERPLRTLMERFDQQTASMGLSVPEPSEGEGRGGRRAGESILHPRVQLRVLLLPEALEHIRTIADLYAIERQLRQRARSQEWAGASGSVLIADSRMYRASARASA